MIFLQSALSTVGLVNAVSTGTVTSLNAGQAYNVTKPLVSSTAVGVTDSTNGGIRRTLTGAIKLYDATAGLPENTAIIQGCAFTATGQLCVKIAAVDSDVRYVNGLAVTNDGRVYMAVTTGVLVPVAAFSADETTGDVPFTVTFTDASTNTPTSWLWNFGDGSTSTTQSPVHEYTVVGVYTVTLRARNAAGYDDEVKTNYITVEEAPEYEGPLDLVPGADWLVAYSPAIALAADKLGDTALTIRRESDSATNNFSYDATTGLVDGAAGDAFVGAPFNKTGTIDIEIDDTLLVVTNASGIFEGQPVSGVGIEVGTVVDAIDGTDIYLSESATESSVAGTFTFTPHGFVSMLADNVGANNISSSASEQPWWSSDDCNDFPAILKSIPATILLETAGDLEFAGGVFTVFLVAKREAVGQVAGSTPPSSNVQATVGPDAILTEYDGTNVAEGGYTNVLSETAYIVWDGVIAKSASRNLKANGTNVTETSNGDDGGVIATIDGEFYLGLGPRSSCSAFLMAKGELSGADRTLVRNWLTTNLT